MNGRVESNMDAPKLNSEEESMKMNLQPLTPAALYARVSSAGRT